MDQLQKRKLFIVWNKAMSKASKSPDKVKIRQRLRKALGILQSNDYYQAEKAEYSPTYYSCGCKDWEFHLAKNRAYRGHCKHMMAEILLARIEELHYQQLKLFEDTQFTGKIWVSF